MKRLVEDTPSKKLKQSRLHNLSVQWEDYIEEKRNQFNGSFSSKDIACILADVLNDDEDLEQFTSNQIEPQFDSLLVEQLADLSEIQFDEKPVKVETFYDLPIYFKRLLQEVRGIKELYDWQDDMLKIMLRNEKNIIYCVPTSGGKTLVAEIMMFRELMLSKKNVILILPYISLVQEKIRTLLPFSLKAEFIIEEYAGTKGKIPCVKRIKNRSLYIATIEKAHLILTSLIEENRLGEIGLVVIDELHMIGDGSSRGAILESLIVKMKLAKKQNFTERLRVIGMSATLSNLDDISKFMDAEVVKKEFRPVELRQFVKFGDAVYEYLGENSPDEKKFDMVRTLPRSVRTEDPENLKALMEEVMPEMPTLIFAPTKSHCENIATMLTKVLKQDLLNFKIDKKRILLRDLAMVTNNAVCPVLRKSLPFGISYHHSGLTSDERELIEGAFLEGTINCIVCTSTLAAGINLPAQRVIIRSPYTGREFLTPSMYRQMCGRAGRAGFSDRPGESILIVRNTDFEKIKEFFKPLQNVCISSFTKDSEKSISYLILVLMHLKLVRNEAEGLDAVLHQTLFGIQADENDNNFQAMVKQSLQNLQTQKLVELDKQKELCITSLGRAIVKSLFDLNKSNRIYGELLQAQKGINLNTNLHLIYICTFGFSAEELPYGPDPQVFLDMYMELSDAEQNSAAVIGVTGGLVMQYRNRTFESLPVKRFFLTMMMYQLWQYGVEINVLSRKFRMQRGNIQSYINQFTSAASSLLRFVNELPEFWGLRNLFPTICERLTYCSTPELIPLMELPHVRMPRAKALYGNGYKTLEQVAQAPLYDLCSKIERLSVRHAFDIIKFAKKKFLDRADELESEIEHLKKLGHRVTGEEPTDENREIELPTSNLTSSSINA